MPGWGTGSWGISPWGTGSAPTGPFFVVKVWAINSNTIRVTYSAAPQTDHDLLANDALNASNYVVTLVSGPDLTWTPRISRVYTVDTDPLSVDLRTDRSMPGIIRVRQTLYRLTVSNVTSAAGDPLIGANWQNFYSLNQIVNETQVRLENNSKRDVANPSVPNSPMGGTFTIDSTGDLKTDSGITMLKKLLTRRLVTRPGGFFHLPEYGIGLNPKELARPYRILEIKNEMKRQFLNEPEVLSVDVSVRMLPGTVLFDAKIKTKTNGDVDLKFPFNTQS